MEGNPDHPATRGACDVFSQASVLSLYDPDRSDTVRRGGEIASFGSFLAALEKPRREWDANGGAGLGLLTDTMTSPSRAAHIAAMQKRWPKMRWFAHDPARDDAVLRASGMAFGQRLEPRYHVERAAVLCILDADLLGAMPGFLHHACGFAERRRPTPDKSDMSRIYALESTPNVTGANADHRRQVAAEEMPVAVRARGRTRPGRAGWRTNAPGGDRQGLDPGSGR